MSLFVPVDVLRLEVRNLSLPLDLDSLGNVGGKILKVVIRGTRAQVKSLDLNSLRNSLKEKGVLSSSFVFDIIEEKIARNVSMTLLSSKEDLLLIYLEGLQKEEEGRFDLDFVYNEGKKYLERIVM